MHKKVFKGDKEYYAIYIEDINSLIGELTDIIGTTRKKVMDYGQFDNYVTLNDCYKGFNVIVDTVKHHNMYLTVYDNGHDTYSFDLYTEEEFNNNFIDEIELKEIRETNGILFYEFKETLDFIKEQDNKMNDFCDALEQLSPGEYCNCFLYNKYEEKLLDMMCKAMRLSESKIDILMWWLYDMDWGSRITENSLQDEKGNNINLTTIEKLYNYLVGE